MLIFEEQQQSKSTLKHLIRKALTKGFQDSCLSSLRRKSSRTLKKYQPRGFENLNGIVNKMNNTKLFLTGMKPKDAITMGIFRLDRSENCPEENVSPRSKKTN